MDAGIGSWVGHPPKVTVVERMLLQDVPEEERGAFLVFLGSSAQVTRSGEIVFPKEVYKKWKQK